MVCNNIALPLKFFGLENENVFCRREKMMGNEFGIESMGICGIEQTTSYYPTEAVKVYSE